jgi:hypothetical protein
LTTRAIYSVTLSDIGLIATFSHVLVAGHMLISHYCLMTSQKISGQVYIVVATFFISNQVRNKTHFVYSIILGCNITIMSIFEPFNIIRTFGSVLDPW